jgi:hypothetical protein
VLVKAVCKHIDEIDPRYQFHQYFMRSFCVLKIWVCNFLAYNFSKRSAYKMLMKMTTGIQRKCNQEDEEDDQVGVNIL